MKIKKQFQGLSSNRYSREPLEKLFAEMWQEQNEIGPYINTCTLDYLLSDNADQHYIEKTTEENHIVAATIIQWLGSAVGQGFLAKVIEEAKNKEIPMPMFEPVRTCFGASLVDPNWR